MRIQAELIKRGMDKLSNPKTTPPKKPEEIKSEPRKVSKTINNYLEEYIMHNKELDAFFFELKKYIYNYRESEINKAYDAVREYAKLYIEDIKRLNELQKALPQNILDNLTDGSTLYKIPALGNREELCFGLYTCHEEPFKTKFGDMELSEMMKTDSNPYIKEYETWKNDHKDLDSEIIKLESELEKDRKKGFIFNKKKKQAMLEEKEAKLQTLKEEQAKGTSLKSKSETFDNLTPEDRAKITRYLSCLEHCIESSSKFATLVDEFDKVNGLLKDCGNVNDIVRNINITFLLESAVKNRKLTEQQITSAINGLTPELKEGIIASAVNNDWHLYDYRCVFYKAAFYDEIKERRMAKFGDVNDEHKVR